MKQSEFESQLVEMFEDNFRFLCEEAGHSINEYLKKLAFDQVLYYYRKNKKIIEQITRAEVK